MNPPIHVKTITLPILISFVLACLALAPTIHAVDPPPDGFYPGGNTAEGEDALFSLLPDLGVAFNTAIGFNALYSTTTGSSNTATGAEALFSNTTGLNNTATGSEALLFNTTGRYNTAIGQAVLLFNTTGSRNTATGVSALLSNTEGNANTANGYHALGSNTTGSNNTANGALALSSFNTGDNNTATGFQALLSNTEGTDNTANGLNALFDNISGSENTANGHSALQSNTTGNDNIAVGHGAGQNLTTGDNNIDIGNVGVAGEANTIRIGHPGVFVPPNSFVGGHTATFIAGIYNATVAKGVGVVIDSSGQLGTKGSSQRFKAEIKPMDKLSEAILALKPVTFVYKQELDPEGIPQFGLVAEDVEKVNPDLVARDDKGKVYTVRYDAVNAMLLNEFLKEHRKNEEQEKRIDALTAQLKEQAAQIQEVSAQLEVNKPAPQVVNNNQ